MQNDSYQRIKHLNNSDLINLCAELREYLINIILNNGGHFAGNLGVIELTVCLLKCYNPKDNDFIWDVGHQSYIYKMLTNRKDKLNNIRQWKGISGFPKLDESEYDYFGTGHSSTALSAAVGLAIANKLNGLNRKTIAIVGDGAMTGGMFWEALNNITSDLNNLILIINDNQIGIDPNTGNIALYLNNLNVKSNFFTDLGFEYRFVADGHNIESLINKIEIPNSKPLVIHVKTVKGKGYLPAEQAQTKFHSTSKFVKIDKNSTDEKWHNAFGGIVFDLLKANNKNLLITPAMPSGSGLTNSFAQFPNQCFDVGIAEQHAITFAAALATKGFIPIVSIYSTFLQRALDQVIHDVAIQNLPMILAIDRAGLVGEDGPTHHGAFDISMLNPIPNIEIWAPANKNQLATILNYAIVCKKIVAVRYPKGSIKIGQPYNFNLPFLQLSNGLNKIIITVGNTTNWVSSQNLNNASWIQLIQIKPIPQELLFILKSYTKVLVVEDGSIAGGVGEKLLVECNKIGINPQFTYCGIGNYFVPHGANNLLYSYCNYSQAHINDWLNVN